MVCVYKKISSVRVYWVGLKREREEEGEEEEGDEKG